MARGARISRSSAPARHHRMGREDVQNIYLFFRATSGRGVTLPVMETTTAALAAVICEDDTLAATALVDTLNGLYGFEVVALVTSGDDVVAATARTQPNVVVVDLALAGEAGLRIVAALREAAPGCAVVVLVASPFGRLRASAEDAGAMALVEMDDLRPLRRCLEQVHLRSHAENCPSCPAARPPGTAAAVSDARSDVRASGQISVQQPGVDPSTGRPPSSSSGPD